MKVFSRSVRIAVFLAAASFFGACAGRSGGPGSAWRPNREVVAHVAPFWEGAAPGSGGGGLLPAAILTRGEPVRFLRNDRGFSEVELPGGRVGWMPRGTLGAP